MKVLIVNDLGTDTGGAERVSVTLRDELRERGHDARLFSSVATPLPEIDVLADDTCFSRYAPYRPVLATANPFALAGLQRTLARFRPDVVHLRMFLWHLSPLVLRALRRVPTLVHVVNYDLICPMNTKTLPTGEPCHHKPGRVCLREKCLGPAGLARATAQRALLHRWLPNAADRLVTNSHWVRERLEAEGVRVDGVIWNGVTVTPTRDPLEPGPPAIGFAGRLVPKKGVDVLLEALPMVRERVPGATLLIAGDGPLREALEHRATELHVRDAVNFLGHLPKEAMADAFRHLWVQAAPSTWEEPFGLVAAEAMMRGTAAVVTRTGGLGEQVIPGETGYHAEPGDARSLASALVKVVGDRNHAEFLGARGRERALAEFSLGRFVDRVEESYQKLIKNPA